MRRKIKYYMILGLVLLATMLFATSALGAINLGSQKGAKHGDGTTKDTIFITGQKATIHDVFDDADVTTAHLQEISSNHRYLLNVSIQVNETGILCIEGGTCDWLMLASIDGKIANITCYGRMFINNTLVTAVNWASGGSNNSANDTTYATGAKTRPSIRVNNSEGTGDSILGMTNARIAYLGGNKNESYGGVCVNDTDGSPKIVVSNAHISHCYDGLFIKSIISATALSRLNVTNNERFGIRLDADSAINFTACNSTNNLIDWYFHPDTVSIINNTDAHYILGPTDSSVTSKINNVTQKFRTVSHTRGQTVFNATSWDIQVTTSDNDYCNLNWTTYEQWTGQTLDADFVQFVIAGYQPSTNYVLEVNNAHFTEANPDKNGHITLNYTGTWSTKDFVVKRVVSSHGGSSYVPPATTTTTTTQTTETEETSPTLSVVELTETTATAIAIILIASFLIVWKLPYLKKYKENRWLIMIGVVVLVLLGMGFL